MHLLKNKSDSIYLNIPLDELITIQNALNEICHGIEVFEFQTRIGVTKEEVKILMEKILEIIVEVELKN